MRYNVESHEVVQLNFQEQLSQLRSTGIHAALQTASSCVCCPGAAYPGLTRGVATHLWNEKALQQPASRKKSATEISCSQSLRPAVPWTNTSGVWLQGVQSLHRDHTEDTPAIPPILEQDSPAKTGISVSSEISWHLAARSCQGSSRRKLSPFEGSPHMSHGQI